MVRNTKLSNEEYQQKLDEYKVVEWVLVSNYLGKDKPITLLHKGCGREVEHPSASNVFRVKNCRLCSPENFKKSHDQVAEDLLKIGLKLHGKYIDDRTSVAIEYPCGHVHTKTTTQVKQGSGVRCLLCEPRTPQTRLPLESVNQSLKDAEFGSFRVIGDYSGVSNPTDIECLECGFVEYEARPYDILKRVGGCQICGKLQSTESVNHRFIKRVLYDLGLKFVSEKTFDGLVSEKGFKFRFDFYLTEHKLLIEYDGKYHENEYHKYTDPLKDKFCIQNGYKLLRISCDEKGIIHKILSSIKCNDYPEKEYTVSD